MRNGNITFRKTFNNLEISKSDQDVLVDKMIKAIDFDGDNKISMSDFEFLINYFNNKK